MKVIEHLQKNISQVSFEILPPLKGRSVQTIFEILDPLMDFAPPFVNVTYHRAEYIQRTFKDGSMREIAIRKRPGTVSICAALMHRYKVDAVPHLICGGFSKDQTEDALIDLHFLGVNNVLALRGDKMKSENQFTPEPNGHSYAIDLVKQIKRMNEGRYLEQELSNGEKTDFCIGVAGYPETHSDAPNFETDIQHLKAKVDKGADFIVTQMFWDNNKYFEFVDACRKADINVPIIPGLKPLTSRSQIQNIGKAFSVAFPEELLKEVSKVPDDKVKEVGIEWCINQSKELQKRGVPCLHYYVMSNVKEVHEITRKSL